MPAAGGGARRLARIRALVRAARRPPARLSGRPRHRHQRQGSTAPHGERAARWPAGSRSGPTRAPTSRRVNERIARNGEPIDDDELAEVLEALAHARAAAAASASTRFELLTAAAFSLVRRRRRRRGGGRGGARRALGRHQRGRRRRGRGHQRRATTTPRSSARPSPTSPRRRPGIVKPGCRSWSGRDRPGAGRRLFRGRRRRQWASPRPGCAATSSTASRNAVAGGRPSARPAHARAPATTRCSCRCTAPTGRQRRRAPWPRPRPSSARRSSDEVVEQAFGRCACPAGSRSSGTHPLVLLDGAHNVAGAPALARALAEDFAVEGDDGGRGRHARGPRPGDHARGAARRRGDARRGLPGAVAAAALPADGRRPRPHARSGIAAPMARATPSTDALELARAPAGADGLSSSPVRSTWSADARDARAGIDGDCVARSLPAP